MDVRAAEVARVKDEIGRMVPWVLSAGSVEQLEALEDACEVLGRLSCDALIAIIERGGIPQRC